MGFLYSFESGSAASTLQSGLYQKSPFLHMTAFTGTKCKAAVLAFCLTIVLPLSLSGQSARTGNQAQSQNCPPACPEWNQPREPLKIFGNTWFVGTQGISAILITSDAGHVLIDAGTAAAAGSVIASIKSLGLDLRDVRLILNSHAHYDHSGGIARIQQVSGARVDASPWSAATLERGTSSREDPLYLEADSFPRVENVRVITDGEKVTIGGVTLTAHFTPGHTPGSTSWTWQSCEGDRCLNLVYADSQTPVSDSSFRYSGNERYPNVLRDFERGFALLEQLPCDILLTPHPGASQMWQRLSSGSVNQGPSLVDTTACQRYAANARQQLARKVASEK